MNEVVLQAPLPRTITGTAMLRMAGRTWFTVAVLGQWVFAAYVAAFYGGAVLDGDLLRWNKQLPHGYVPGDAAGNFAVAAHLALAVVLLVCGPLQFAQSLRARFPAWHRWNGRVWLTTVVVTALVGAFMVITRGTIGDLPMHLGFYLDAVLVTLFAALALRRARARDFAAHRVWALRLFMVANAVWFFRIGFFLWVVIQQGPVGFDPKTFTGPFITFMAFAQTLVPLAALQLYLEAERRGSKALRIGVAGSLFVLTAVMTFGLYVLTIGRWIPRVLGAA
jgi:uncharacterized membrane protein